MQGTLNAPRRRGGPRVRVASKIDFGLFLVVFDYRGSFQMMANEENTYNVIGDRHLRIDAIEDLPM